MDRELPTMRAKWRFARAAELIFDRGRPSRLTTLCGRRARERRISNSGWRRRFRGNYIRPSAVTVVTAVTWACFTGIQAESYPGQFVPISVVPHSLVLCWSTCNQTIAFGHLLWAVFCHKAFSLYSDCIFKTYLISTLHYILLTELLLETHGPESVSLFFSFFSFSFVTFKFWP